jgi:hypothetical protein
MKVIICFVAAAILSSTVAAQEKKPVPKDSMRVAIPGCAKGYVFTAGARTEEQPGGSGVPEGTHLRMNGPKAMMAEIKGQEGSRIEITGLIKKGQVAQDGVRIAPGVRVSAGSPSGGGPFRDPGVNQIAIDVEGWRRVSGDCPSR